MKCSRADEHCSYLDALDVFSESYATAENASVSNRCNYTTTVVP